MQVTLQFFPDFERLFTETVFVELEGRAARVPLAVSGAGLGPSAIFSYDVLDVGNTFIHTTHRYDVLLENRGEVPVPFTVAKGPGPLAHAFAFTPEAGVVPVDASLQLGVKLLGDRLGKFDERMFLRVTGTDKQLSVQFKGRVVGPTFSVDAERLGFGVVAYGFRCARLIDHHVRACPPMRTAFVRRCTLRLLLHTLAGSAAQPLVAWN